LIMIRVAIRNRMYARKTISTLGARRCHCIVLSNLKRPLQVDVSVTSTNWNWRASFAGKVRGLCSSTLSLVHPLFPSGPILLASNVVLWISPPGIHRQECYCCCHEECPRWRRRRASTTAVPRFSTADGPPRDHQPVPPTRRGVVLSTFRHYSTTSSISHGSLKRHSSFSAADGVHNA